MPSPEPRAPTPPSSSASLAAYRTPSCPAPSSTVFIASGLSTRAMEEVLVTESISARSARRSMTRYLAYVPADRLLIADAGADCPRYGPYQIQPGSMGPVHGSCWLCILVGCVFFLFSILCSPPYGSTYIIIPASNIPGSGAGLMAATDAPLEPKREILPEGWKSAFDPGVQPQVLLRSERRCAVGATHRPCPS